jgi:hypothetical protein
MVDEMASIVKRNETNKSDTEVDAVGDTLPETKRTAEYPMTHIYDSSIIPQLRKGRLW